MKKEKNQILRDIAEVYRFLEQQNQSINKLYEEQNLESVFPALSEVFLEVGDSAEICFACVDRIVGLKEAPLLNLLKKLEIPEEKCLHLRTLLFEITRDFYAQKHREVLEFIEEKNLLTPFLRALVQSVHRIGSCFNSFFEAWQRRLILGINQELHKQFKGDYGEILKALESSIEECGEDFYQTGGFSQKGELSDRSYSVPVFEGLKYKAMPYVKFFKEEFDRLRIVFKECLRELEKTPEICQELEQKEAYIFYLHSLESALMQENVGSLLESWRLVDKAWMQISTPLQIGHPLEYYEDHFRKSVAPEWDLRIARIYEGVDLLGSGTENGFKISKESVLKFYEKFNNTLPETTFKEAIFHCVVDSLSKTQSYGGMPMLFYGAELNGLFSAQVVPNDEKVSQKYGKKIFYFPDRVRELSMAKPFMLLSSKTFPKEFLDFNRALLYFRKEDWYKVYEITTVGHEFGHILWVDFDSELCMNQSGQFKNIEEFKATMGGLAYYFLSQDKSLLKEVVANMVARSVGLIAWMKEDEVLPYYCEGLIHLNVLFSSGVLRYLGDFNAVALEVCFHESALEKLQQVYLETYRQLILFYLNKQDAKEFLSFYMDKDENGFYKPIAKEVRNFVEDYYKEYVCIGQVKDELTPQMWKKKYQEFIKDKECCESLQ